MYGDLGYLGIHDCHGNSIIPIKVGRNNPLSEKERAYNKRLSRKRVAVEHINAKIKTFKIMAYPYRNHCKGHLLRLSLICGFINYENRCK
jgi:IS5 family transposase